MTTIKNDKKFQFGREQLFQLFKYSLYLFLMFNVYLFFQEDYSASSQTFSDGISFSQIIQAFTATIDTAAWVVLLLLFELETYVLEDEQLKGTTKWSMNIISVICYSFIIYSFYGYLSKYFMINAVQFFAIDDVCSLISNSFTYIEDLDEYLPITAENCGALANTPLFQVEGTNIVSTEYHLIEAQRLALVDVINSANWLVIVLILDGEVFLQLRGKLTKKIISFNKMIKVVLYSVLLLAAIYWGLKGDFFDFWDAFLWIIAFIFIELNIFEWNAETQGDENKIVET